MVAEAVESIEFSAHVRKCGSIHIDRHANFGAKVFLSCTHVVKVSVVGEERHELGCVFRVALRQRIKRADNLFVAGLFGCLDAHNMPFKWGRLPGSSSGTSTSPSETSPGSFHGQRRRPRGRLSFPFLLSF